MRAARYKAYMGNSNFIGYDPFVIRRAGNHFTAEEICVNLA
jgi:hypothetical protein